MGKNSFILHNDSLDVLDELTNEQAGMLLKAMRAFHCGEKLELDTLTKIAFSPFKNQFDRDEIKYQKIVDRNKTNGLKGGRPPNPREAKKPTGLSGNPSKPKQPDSVNDSDSDNVSGNDIGKALKDNDESLFYEFWNTYGKKVGIDKCKAKFNKLKKSEIEKIFSTLDAYVSLTPDIQYRKNPLTYLNGSCWNDELIASSSTQGYSKVTQQNLIEAEKWERSFDQ